MTALLLTEGPFGQAVAEELARHVAQLEVRRLTEACRPPRAAALDEVLGGASCVLAASWREYPDELDLLDAACRALAMSWTSVVLEGSAMRAGPVIGAASACYRCFRRRIAQHAAAPERDRALEDLYRRHPAVGVAGFTPSMVGLAAAHLRLHLHHQVAPGTVDWFDLLSGGLERSSVVAVHGCARCGPGPAVTGSRYNRHLIARLGVADG